MKHLKSKIILGLSIVVIGLSGCSRNFGIGGTASFAQKDPQQPVAGSDRPLATQPGTLTPQPGTIDTQTSGPVQQVKCSSATTTLHTFNDNKDKDKSDDKNESNESHESHERYSSATSQTSESCLKVKTKNNEDYCEDDDKMLETALDRVLCESSQSDPESCIPEDSLHIEKSSGKIVLVFENTVSQDRIANCKSELRSTFE